MIYLVVFSLTIIVGGDSNPSTFIRRIGSCQLHDFQRNLVVMVEIVILILLCIAEIGVCNL